MCQQSIRFLISYCSDDNKNRSAILANLENLCEEKLVRIMNLFKWMEMLPCLGEVKEEKKPRIRNKDRMRKIKRRNRRNQMRKDRASPPFPTTSKVRNEWEDLYDTSKAKTISVSSCDSECSMCVRMKELYPELPSDMKLISRKNQTQARRSWAVTIRDALTRFLCCPFRHHSKPEAKKKIVKDPVRQRRLRSQPWLGPYEVPKLKYQSRKSGNEMILESKILDRESESLSKSRIEIIQHSCKEQEAKQLDSPEIVRETLPFIQSGEVELVKEIEKLPSGEKNEDSLNHESPDMSASTIPFIKSYYDELAMNIKKSLRGGETEEFLNILAEELLVEELADDLHVKELPGHGAACREGAALEQYLEICGQFHPFQTQKSNQDTSGESQGGKTVQISDNLTLHSIPDMGEVGQQMNMRCEDDVKQAEPGPSSATDVDDDEKIKTLEDQLRKSGVATTETGSTVTLMGLGSRREDSMAFWELEEQRRMNFLRNLRITAPYSSSSSDNDDEDDKEESEIDEDDN